MERRIALPMSGKVAASLRAGDAVLLTGEMYTGRDAAHKRLVALLDSGEQLPVDFCGETVYYVGPSPTPPDFAVGSAGPTTSGRMDKYAPALLDIGLRVMIGKGKRNDEVKAAMKRNGAVYLGVTGGAAALVSRCITKSEVICYEDLGAEAIHRFTVKDFPATVIIDTEGNDLYEMGRERYEVKE